MEDSNILIFNNLSDSDINILKEIKPLKFKNHYDNTLQRQFEWLCIRYHRHFQIKMRYCALTIDNDWKSK